MRHCGPYRSTVCFSRNVPRSVLRRSATDSHPRRCRYYISLLFSSECACGLLALCGLRYSGAAQKIQPSRQRRVCGHAAATPSGESPRKLSRYCVASGGIYSGSVAGQLAHDRERYHGGRALTEAEPPDVVVATTPEELRNAISSGARHISLQAHMDLTYLPVLLWNDDDTSGSLLGPVSKDTQSITGNCSLSGTANLGSIAKFREDFLGPEDRWQDGQCMLAVHTTALNFTEPLWLDSLYFKVVDGVPIRFAAVSDPNLILDKSIERIVSQQRNLHYVIQSDSVCARFFSMTGICKDFLYLTRSAIQGGFHPQPGCNKSCMDDILDQAKENSLRRFERKMTLAPGSATMSMYNREGKGMVVKRASPTTWSSELESGSSFRLGALLTYSKVYAKDVFIANIAIEDGDHEFEGVVKTMLPIPQIQESYLENEAIKSRARQRFVNCTFHDNVLPRPAASPGEDAVKIQNPQSLVRAGPAWLQSCTFINNTASDGSPAQTLVGVFYSDGLESFLGRQSEIDLAGAPYVTGVDPDDLAQLKAVADPPAASLASFLSADDPFIVNAAEEIGVDISMLISAAQQPATPPVIAPAMAAPTQAPASTAPSTPPPPPPATAPSPAAAPHAGSAPPGGAVSRRPEQAAAMAAAPSATTGSGAQTDSQPSRATPASGANGAGARSGAGAASSDSPSPAPTGRPDPRAGAAGSSSASGSSTSSWNRYTSTVEESGSSASSGGPSMAAVGGAVAAVVAAAAVFAMFLLFRRRKSRRDHDDLKNGNGGSGLVDDPEQIAAVDAVRGDCPSGSVKGGVHNDSLQQPHVKLANVTPPLVEAAAITSGDGHGKSIPEVRSTADNDGTAEAEPVLAISAQSSCAIAIEGGESAPSATPPVVAHGAASDTVDSLGGSAQASVGVTTTAASGTMSAGVQSLQTTGVTTSFAVATVPYDTEIAAGENTVAQQKERLMTELDHMRSHGELFLGQFTVLPWTERREGGQGVVQFMRSTRSDEAVATKFFLSRSAFDTELELYQVDVLRSMMPAVRLELGNADGVERNSRGYPWPPCIVLEKGESLQEWKAKMRPAFSTIVDALCLITERLAQLHGSGWAHRDLKPGNVLRLPGQHSWTLMDFGCAARTGEVVPLTFSPAYAPPEVAQAAERGDRTIVADAAADMWALGVMALELLTGAPVFPLFCSTRESIWAQLCGREPLPWEEGAPEQAEKLSELKALKRAVLHCLQRLPEDRPTAEQVLLIWRNLFESRTAARQGL